MFALFVNGDDPVVRYALDAGLMAEETLPSADPENDGITILEEFLFGGSPVAFDSPSILPQLATDMSQAQPMLTASFRRRKVLPDGRKYHIRISHDLQAWIDYPLSSGSSTDIDPTWENFSLTIDPSTVLPDGKRAFIMWDVE